MRIVILFVHGAGRTGRSAWPMFDRGDALFMDLSGIPTVRARAGVIAETILRQPEPPTVVAHSHGALAVALCGPDVRMSRLVLVEPALYDIARGSESVEHHIQVAESARLAYERGGLEAYWRVIRPLMFGGEFDERRWPEEKEPAERFRRVESPWGFGICAADITDGRDTTVVTGGWIDEYEAIADSLVGAGATHRVLTGAQHRPQDLEGFADILG